MSEKHKILICEDDPDLIEIMLLLLSADYDVKAIDNCEDILSTLENFHPNLILMDLRIPVMGGEKATEMLKSNQQYKDIPVLIVSANNEISKVAKRVNAADYMPKPFNVKAFKKKVSELVSV